MPDVDIVISSTSISRTEQTDFCSLQVSQSEVFLLKKQKQTKTEAKGAEGKNSDTELTDVGSYLSVALILWVMTPLGLGGKGQKAVAIPVRWP